MTTHINSKYLSCSHTSTADLPFRGTVHNDEIDSDSKKAQFLCHHVSTRTEQIFSLAPHQPYPSELFTCQHDRPISPIYMPFVNSYENSCASNVVVTPHPYKVDQFEKPKEATLYTFQLHVSFLSTSSSILSSSVIDSNQLVFVSSQHVSEALFLGAALFFKCLQLLKLPSHSHSRFDLGHPFPHPNAISCLHSR